MKPRLLVVEDSATQAEVLRSDLEDAGFAVTLAHSGAEGLGTLESQSFDLVLSDVVMPGRIDGYELARRIKNGQHSNLPVVLLTALSDPLEIINGLEAGADNFLRKPYAREDLAHHIHALLATRNARRTDRVSMGVKVLFMDREFTITSDKEQILDLLVSTFEEAVRRNRELSERERELEKAQAALAGYARSLEARLAQVLSSVPDVVFSVSPDLSRWLYVSPGSTNLLGCPPDRLNSEYWRSHVLVEDQDRSGALIEEAVRTRKPRDLEFRFRRNGDGVRWISGTVIPVLSADGSVERLDGVIHDVTDRRNAEDALRASETKFATLFHASPIPKGISSWEDARFVEVNQSFVDHTGWPAGEAVSRTATELGLWSDEIQVRIIDELAGHGSIHNLEVEYRNRDGDERVALYSAEMMVSSGGSQVLWLLNDITERRVLEAQLRQSQKMEAIGRLTGGVAHDFNNLLTVILSNAELIRETLSGDTDARQELADLMGAAQRGSTLVRKLLAFSHRAELFLQPTRPGPIIREAGSMLRTLLPESIALDLRMDDAVRPVLLDEGALEQILLNLATNARDAMPAGGHFSVVLEAVTMDEESCRVHGWGIPGDYARISVSDDGEGMSRETVSRIFEPFFTTKPQGKGTGLGMAMVYGLVHQHGGFVNVYSEPGHGTTINLYFPVTDQAVMEGSSPQRPDQARPLIGSETILVVEDEEVIRPAARRVLESQGYSVLLAEDGESALETLRASEQGVDLIITDVVMPGIGGTELARRLREREGRDIRVLFTSGYRSRDLDEADGGAAVDARHFLPKPWTIPQLLTRVRTILDETPVEDMPSAP